MADGLSERDIRQLQRIGKVSAAIAAVSPCPYEWQDGGSDHMCNLIGVPGHRHMCACGEFAPEKAPEPQCICGTDSTGEAPDERPDCPVHGIDAEWGQEYPVDEEDPF